MLKCLNQGCPVPATHIREIPSIGESVWYCQEHMQDDKFIDDYIALTPERIEEEIKAERSTKIAIKSMLKAWKAYRNKWL